jgi:hypothetical protein
MFDHKLDKIQEQLFQIEGNQKKLMATAASILAQVAQEQTDIAGLSTLVGNLIAAFNAQAAGTFTPAQLTTLSAALTADDASVDSLNAAITTALGTSTPPAPTAPQVAAALKTVKAS